MKRIFYVVLSFLKTLFFVIRNPKTDLMFFCSSHIDEIWIRSTIEACVKKGIKCCLVIKSSSNIEELKTRYSKIPLLLVQYVIGLRFFKTKLIVTASSGLKKGVFSKDSKLIHMPHSLVSLHTVYPENAFSGYDYIFATGPHHEREFKKLNGGASFKIGYGKFDIISTRKQELKKAHYTALLAPSWHADNFIEKLDIKFVDSLINKGFYVILRPHPSHFINPIPSIEKIAKHYSKHPLFTIEDSTMEADSFEMSDIMIADYSGVAFEYAMTQLKPVIFINSKPKILNKHWKNVGLEPFEVATRDIFGYVVEPEIKEILKTIKLSKQTDWKKRLMSARKEYVYNFHKCANAALKTIQSLLN